MTAAVRKLSCVRGGRRPLSGVILTLVVSVLYFLDFLLFGDLWPIEWYVGGVCESSFGTTRKYGPEKTPKRLFRAVPPGGETRAYGYAASGVRGCVEFRGRCDATV